MRIVIFSSNAILLVDCDWDRGMEAAAYGGRKSGVSQKPSTTTICQQEIMVVGVSILQQLRKLKVKILQSTSRTNPL